MDDIKSKIKAVIFDMDGTIIKTDHIWNHATSETLKKQGFTTFDDSHRKLLDSLSGVTVHVAWEKLKRELKLEKELNLLVNDTIDEVITQCRKGVEFVTGFQDFHDLLTKHNIPSAIATNSEDKALSELKSIMNFAKYFGSNICNISHVNNVPKPDPALFLHVAEKLGVKPHECIVFEDSMSGVKAAQAAGMKCIIVKHSANAHVREHGHDAIDDYFDALNALRRVIEK